MKPENNYPAWHRSKSKNWAITGGSSFAGGIVSFVEGDILTFTNLDQNRSEAFLLLNVGIGFRAGMSLRSGRLIKSAHKGIRHGNNAAARPASNSPQASVTARIPFSISDLYDTVTSAVVSLGVEAGLVEIGVKGVAFKTSKLGTFCTFTEVQVEQILGVGINIASLHSGVLFGPIGYGTPITQEEKHRQEASAYKNRLPIGPSFGPKY